MSGPLVRVAERAGVGVTGAPRPSEDHTVVLDQAVAVLDGATSLTPGTPGGGWYADLLGAELAKLLVEQPDADLGVTLGEGIRRVAADQALTPGRAPSSTVALVRWTSDRVDALVLADSPVVAFGAGGTRVLADDRLRLLPRSRHRYPALLRTGGGYGEAHAEALREGMGLSARYRNVDGGFWVAEADPAAARHAVRASWERAGVDAVLLATDGVTCGIDDYALFGWPEVLELARSAGPAAVLDAVHEAERADPDGIRWPRPKRHDDKALVLVDGL